MSVSLNSPFVIAQPASSKRLAATTTGPLTGPVPPPQSPAVIDIFHVNDYHEAFGKLPSAITAFTQLGQAAKNQGHTVLKLNAGDNNIASEGADWALNVAMLNQMGIDASTTGNHEYDQGTPQLAQGLGQSRFPWLVSNLEVPPGSSLDALRPSGHFNDRGPQIIEKNGQRFGLIGVTTPTLAKYMREDTPMEGVHPVSEAETAGRIQAQVNALQNQGIHQVILLSHMGYEADKKLIAPPSEGGLGVTGVDVIIGGHSHTELEGVVPNQSLFRATNGAPVVIAQTGKNLHHLGHLQVWFDELGHVHPLKQELLKPQAFAPNPVAQRWVETQFGPNPVVATLAQPYYSDAVEERPDPLANFFSDALLETSWRASNPHEQADFAFTRAPSIKDGAPAGPISRLDARLMMPYNNPHLIMALTGQEIMGTLEGSAQGLKNGTHHPGLLHPSGNLRVVLNKQTGHLQSALWLNPKTSQWEPLNPTQTYRVAMDDYPASSEEYPFCYGRPVLSRFPGSMSDLLAAFLAMQQAKTPNQPVSLKTDGRLQVVG